MSEIDRADYIAINTHPLVMMQIPSSSSEFDDAACREWIAGKGGIWEQHRYGPWVFVIDDHFAG